MAVTAFASGTQTTTVTTLHTLASVNQPGTYTLHVDTQAMAAGDVIELWISQMVLTGGAVNAAYVERFAGVQNDFDLVKISVPISNELTDSQSLIFAIIQTFGTSRAFPWKVLKHA